jgi:phage terminase small subunit
MTEQSKPTKGRPPKATIFKKYPPPKKGKIYREKWELFIVGLAERENFKIAHLSQLEILCDLYVEYAQLKRFIKKNGYTYESVGRNGDQRKPFPEVYRLSRVESLIKEYSKSLGIMPKRDTSIEDGDQNSEWA